MSRLSRSHSELRVRMLDYDDFSSPGKDDVSKFFRDIGSLNAVFRKRLNQSLTLHPCVPLADLFQEYTAYQKALEGKYNISFPARTSRASVAASPEAPTSLPSNPIQPFGSFSSTTSSTPAAIATPAMEPKSFSSSLSADDNVRPSKRKAEYDREGEEPPKKSDQAPAVQPSAIPKPSGGGNPPPFGDSRSFESRLRKPTATLKPPEELKKVAFPGFNLSKSSTSTAQSPSFASIFPGFSSTDTAAGGKQSSSEKIAQENHTENVEKPATEKKLAETAGESSANFTFKIAGGSSKSQDQAKEPSSSGGKPAVVNSIFGSSGLNFGSGFGTGSSLFPGFQAPAFPSFGGFPPVPKPASEDEDATNDQGGDEPYEPPVVKPEEQEVIEPDAAISSKCKVFYLDGTEFKSRGLGTAHLKTINSDAVQLLIRVSTSIGTVLLNTRITKDTKVSRGHRNKNESVDVLCLADPSIKGIDAKKPVQFVIKFKDAPVADEFYNKLKEMLKN